MAHYAVKNDWIAKYKISPPNAPGFVAAKKMSDYVSVNPTQSN